MIRGAAIAAVLLALGLSWTPPPAGAGGPNPFSVVRAGAPPGPVVLESVRTGVLWRQYAVPPTSAVVQNVSDRPARCEVWWILARTGDESPWVDPVMESTPIIVNLAAGATAQPELDAVSVLTSETGLFHLSFWVHCGSTHSDGATMRALVEVLGDTPGLERVGPHSSTYWIDSAGLDKGRPATVHIALANANTEPATVRAWVSVSHAGTGYATSALISINGSGLTTADLTLPHPPAPGTYRLDVRIDQERATGAVAVDDAWTDVVVGS